MLNVMAKEGHVVVGMNGSIAEILCDFTMIVKSIGEEMKKRDSDVFKEYVSTLLPILAFKDPEDEGFDEAVKKIMENV